MAKLSDSIFSKLAFCLFIQFANASVCYSQESNTLELPAGMVLTEPTIPSAMTGSQRSINEELSKGISPKENAVVWLMAAYGPQIVESSLLESQLAMVGIEQMPADGMTFVPFRDYIESLKLPLDDAIELSIEVQGQIVQSGRQVWSADEWPHLAKYLQANETFLALVTQAASCPHYYAPVLSDQQPPQMLSADLGVERRLEFAVRLLCSRALGRFHEGHLEQGLQDLTTAKRLAFLLANGSPFDVAVSKAHVMDALVFRAQSGLLNSDRASLEVLYALRSLEHSVPEFPPASRAIDIGERAIVHQEIELLKNDGGSLAGFFEFGHEDLETPPKVTLPDVSLVNWTEAIQAADVIWDQIRDAIACQDQAEQKAAFEKLDALYVAWQEAPELTPELFEKNLTTDATEASRAIGRSMAWSLRPLWFQRQATDERYQVRKDLLALQNRLVEFRLRNGEFPATLDELVPDFISKIPNDAHSQKPYYYVKGTEEPFSTPSYLMSFGMNQQNDSGNLYNDDQVITFE